MPIADYLPADLRRYGWYELLNPSEVFGDIMIDYSYVELTSACVTALHKFSTMYPKYRTGEVLNAMAAGGNFLKSIQVIPLSCAVETPSMGA
jgi:cycloartenol synthase